MKHFMKLPDMAALKYREKHALVAAGLIVLLSACSGSDGGDKPGLVAPTATQVDEISTVAMALQSYDAVEASILSPFIEEDLVNQGLYSTHYQSGSQCAGSWDTTSFSFDGAGNASAQFCDGTSFNANYYLNAGVIVLSNIALDGAPIGEGLFEFWGRLADESIMAGARACSATLDLDVEVSENSAGQLGDARNILPPLDTLEFDCNADEYFFLTIDDANMFKAMMESG